MISHRSANRLTTGSPRWRSGLFEKLVADIQAKTLMPEDRYEIAALLESMSWNDERAQETFAVQDVFELASEIWEDIHSKVVTTEFAKDDPVSLKKLIWELFKSFLRGLIFALPMAISVVSMLTLKFSLWSYEYLTVELATCIAIGTILSFVVVGGYTQAIARRGFFYIFQGYYNMARKVTFKFIRFGFLTCILVCGLLFLFNLIFNLFPYDMFMYIVLYFFFLNSIWLSVTVMYILRRELVFTGLIIAGIGIVYVLFVLLELDIITAQLISIGLVSVAGMLLIIYFFRVSERKEEKGISPRMPRLSITVYSITPYFTYGFLYFSFLFLDRIMAWSVNESFMPYFIWFRGEYELGLDFALLALMIPLGVCEVIVSKLMMDVESSYKRYWGFEADKMNRHFERVYYRMMAVVSVASIISAVLIYYFIQVMDGYYFEFAGKHFIQTENTRFVFLMGLISYVILAVGLLNAVIMFSLSQPSFVNQAILPALGTNFIIGFLLTRWVDYTYAVFGLLIGSLVFVVLTFRSMRCIFRKLDFYLFAAS